MKFSAVNSDLFKYSPYKSLSNDQRASIIDIIKSLLDVPISDSEFEAIFSVVGLVMTICVPSEDISRL